MTDLYESQGIGQNIDNSQNHVINILENGMQVNRTPTPREELEVRERALERQVANSCLDDMVNMDRERLSGLQKAIVLICGPLSYLASVATIAIELYDKLARDDENNSSNDTLVKMEIAAAFTTFLLSALKYWIYHRHRSSWFHKLKLCFGTGALASSLISILGYKVAARILVPVFQALSHIAEDVAKKVLDFIKKIKGGREVTLEFNTMAINLRELQNIRGELQNMAHDQIDVEQ
ncbi:hypothetical protein [Chromobacterium sp. ASV23]|uniref:hypothetical protein n=1 Tax=Chromobacterium sp. ASV23 TaxID=2795110 RepID=UPI0018ED1A69|nr:hypothetical protein [Chromobacterium sp. ASV23]